MVDHQSVQCMKLHETSHNLISWRFAQFYWSAANYISLSLSLSLFLSLPFSLCLCLLLSLSLSLTTHFLSCLLSCFLSLALSLRMYMVDDQSTPWGSARFHREWRDPVVWLAFTGQNTPHTHALVHTRNCMQTHSHAHTDMRSIHQNVGMLHAIYPPECGHAAYAHTHTHTHTHTIICRCISLTKILCV